MSDLLSELAPLYAAVVADVLDGMGYRFQTLSAHIRPLTPATKVYGRVFPAQATVVQEIPAEPYKLEIAAVDNMKRGDVLVVDVGDDRTCGFWGELLTTACLYKGIRGVVMTACTRDMWRVGPTLRMLPAVFRLAASASRRAGKAQPYPAESARLRGGIRFALPPYDSGATIQARRAGSTRQNHELRPSVGRVPPAKTTGE